MSFSVVVLQRLQHLDQIWARSSAVGSGGLFGEDRRHPGCHTRVQVSGVGVHLQDLVLRIGTRSICTAVQLLADLAV